MEKFQYVELHDGIRIFIKKKKKKRRASRLLFGEKTRGKD